MPATIDLILIAFYFFVLIAVGYLTSRKQSSESFLISERKLSAFMGMMTVNATKTGSIIFLITALLYEYGSSAAWFFAGAVLGYFIFIPFAKHLLATSKGRYYTLAEYFRDGYGTRAGNYAFALTMFTIFGFLVTNLIAATKVLTFFTELSFVWGAITIAGVVLLYLLLAGFHAVVTTDVIQYGAIVTIFLLLAVSLANGGISIPAKDLNVMGAGLQNIFGFFLIGALIPFAAPELWQRAYALKDYETLKKSVLLSVGFYALVGFLVVLVGLFVKASFAEIDPDLALIQGLTTLLSPGLVGLAVVVFFAALMSSIDTYVYTASSAMVQDTMPDLSKEKTVWRIRIATVILVSTATTVAILLQDLALAVYIFTAFAVTLAIPTILTWAKPSVSVVTLNTTFVVGIFLLAMFVSVGVMTDNLTPIIILKGIGGSLLGLIIGALISRFQHVKPAS